MNIKKLIKEHHQNMIDKGFYDLCDCNEGYGYNCSLCNNETGVVQNKNIGELLMLIISELSEALESHRNNRFSDWVKYAGYLKRHKKQGKLSFLSYKISFNKYIKDTFEDEIADVFLRLFDLCGYLNIEPSPGIMTSKPKIARNVGESLLTLTGEISSVRKNNPDASEDDLGYILSYLSEFSKFHNIEIEKHIYAKMAYNKTRQHKHGKAY